MKKPEVLNSVTRTLHKVGFQIKKHSPEILIVTGVVGTVASAVLACKATTKASAIVEEAKEQLDTIHECANTPELAEDYTAEDVKKDTAIVYAQTGLKFVKLYGPSIALGALSIGCILTSHRILTKRNVALAAAYATVDRGFKEYRGRVIDRFGKELDRELRYNIKAKEVEEEVVDEKTGEVTTVKKTVEVADPNMHSTYARFYDNGCKGWQKDAELNLYFLRCQQNQANEKLKADGYLFLNDVYEMLGIPKTKAGFVVGWIYNEKNPVGDNFVDFGIYDTHNEKARDFVNGYERTILLDFNVDGNILDLM
jgi:hypothetical protein